MTEETHRRWDIIIKAIVMPTIAVLTVLMGVYQYTDGQKKSIEREYELRAIEREQEFFREKSSLYKETRQILSFLATNENVDSDLYLTKESRFWELYWGDLAAVESKEIEVLMVKSGRHLNGLREVGDLEGKKKILNDLQQISLEFARQTNTELLE